MICIKNVVCLLVGLVTWPSFSHKILFCLRLSYGGPLPSCTGCFFCHFPEPGSCYHTGGLHLVVQPMT